MKYLLDASSIYRIAEANKLDIIGNSITIDLAKYELGNAVLKDCVIHKLLDPSKAQQLVDFLYELLGTMDIVSVSDGKDIMKTAMDFKLSFYDAAYVHHSKSTDLILVTEDGKIGKKVGDYIKIISTKELLKGL